MRTSTLPGFARIARDTVMSVASVGHISRRAMVAAVTAGVATLGAPAVLRRRFRLFAGSATEYSARAIRLV